MIDFLNTWQENGDYLRMVKLMGQLSNFQRVIFLIFTIGLQRTFFVNILKPII